MCSISLVCYWIPVKSGLSILIQRTRFDVTSRPARTSCTFVHESLRFTELWWKLPLFVSSTRFSWPQIAEFKLWNDPKSFPAVRIPTLPPPSSTALVRPSCCSAQIQPLTPMEIGDVLICIFPSHRRLTNEALARPSFLEVAMSWEHAAADNTGFQALMLRSHYNFFTSLSNGSKFSSIFVG